MQVNGAFHSIEKSRVINNDMYQMANGKMVLIYTAFLSTALYSVDSTQGIEHYIYKVACSQVK